MSEYVSSAKGILLGFEVDTGKPVYVSLHHLAIFGMTQKSGKTTTLEALIVRSKLRAIAFKTKRGEAGFHDVNVVTPYYKPRSGWQFIEGLVNVALGEKVKYEPAMRWAIMKVSENTQGDLKKVLAKAQDMKEKARKAFIKQTFEKLVNYLKIVVPELEKWTFSDRLSLQNGVNVMDLTGMKLETQQIVIASTVGYVSEKLRDTVVVIPEAWETLPQGKMTPVKWVTEQFIRKGASVGNYLWIDSQDIGGVDKTPLRQCDNWIMGRMKEAHEIERILKQLLGQKIPAKDIQTLALGHFFAVIGNRVAKVYVLPAGVPENIGQQVALGELKPEVVRDQYLKPVVIDPIDRDHLAKIKELEKFNENARAQIKLMETELKHYASLELELQQLKAQLEATQKALKDFEELKNLYSRIFFKDMPKRAVVSKSLPATLELEHKELTVNVTHSQKPVKLTTETQQGKIMYVALHEMPKDGFTEQLLSQAMLERGWRIAHSSLAMQLNVKLPEKGLIIKSSNKKPIHYRVPSKVKMNIVEA